VMIMSLQSKTTYKIPPPVADNRCRNCSLMDACMPFAVQEARIPVDLFTPRREAELP